MSETREKRKVEFIESYWTGGEYGSDYKWNDNHGELIRCKNCKYWLPQRYGDHCNFNGGGSWSKDSFCSNAEIGQPKKGHWIDECPKYDRTIPFSAKDCSVCGHTFYIKDGNIVDFCPHCGADMRVKADGERK